MEPRAFRADLELIPSTLSDLADAAAAGLVRWPSGDLPRRILLTGMGSSWYAASVAAQRMRVAGLDAVAELASAEATWPPSPDLLVVAVSATGSSTETLRAIGPHLGVSRVVALTNTDPSPLGDRADHVVDMRAGVEAGGVACRSYRHTLAALLALEGQLTGRLEVAPVLEHAAIATAHLLDTVDEWRPEVAAALDSPDGVWVLAPFERLSSALQGALMVREGPRRRADGCETGDWSHVDVYLAKTLDYRALVFAGSRFDAAAAEWLTLRGSTVVSVGGPFPGARLEVRHPHDDDPLVALLTEVLIAELVAHAWWSDS
jgi:glutamine---fructose-6-phosphate transaminase (isomerizing)